MAPDRSLRCRPADFHVPGAPDKDESSNSVLPSVCGRSPAVFVSVRFIRSRGFGSRTSHGRSQSGSQRRRLGGASTISKYRSVCGASPSSSVQPLGISARKEVLFPLYEKGRDVYHSKPGPLGHTDQPSAIAHTTKRRAPLRALRDMGVGSAWWSGVPSRKRRVGVFRRRGDFHITQGSPMSPGVRYGLLVAFLFGALAPSDAHRVHGTGPHQTSGKSRPRPSAGRSFIARSPVFVTIVLAALLHLVVSFGHTPLGTKVFLIFVALAAGFVLADPTCRKPAPTA